MCGYPTDDFLPAALTLIPRLPGSWRTGNRRRDHISLGDMSYLRKYGASATSRAISAPDTSRLLIATLKMDVGELPMVKPQVSALRGQCPGETTPIGHQRRLYSL